MVVVDNPHRISERTEPRYRQKLVYQPVNRPDEVGVGQQSLPSVSIAKALLDFSARHVRVGKNADASPTVAPFACQDSEFGDK
jgi:hypothetical protein